MPRVEVDESDVEKWYRTVEDCLKTAGVYYKAIRKFPPATLRGLVKRILERMAATRFDPEATDWCVLFEGVTDYPTADAFFKHLEEDRLIPPEPEEYVRELIEHYERELRDLGYVIVSVKEAKRLERARQLEQEVARLKKQVEILRRELERVTRGEPIEIRLPELAAVERVTRPERPETPESFIARVARYMKVSGIPEVVAAAAAKAREPELRAVFERGVNPVFMGRMYVREMIRDAVVASQLELASMGVVVRKPRQTWRRVREAVIWYYPGFSDALAAVRRYVDYYRHPHMGYAIHEYPPPVAPGLEIVHSADVETDQVRCAIGKGEFYPELKDRLLGCNAWVVAFVFDHVKREIVFAGLEEAKFIERVGKEV